MKQNPIQYKLRKNDIKQITQNEIDYLKNLNKGKKSKCINKIKPGDILKYGRGSFYQVNIKLL